MPSAAVGLIWAPVAAWVITSAPAAVAGCARAAPASVLTLRRELGARMWQRQALQGRAPLAARVASGAGSKARAGALGREAAADVTLVSSPAAAGPLPLLTATLSHALRCAELLRYRRACAEQNEDQRDPFSLYGWGDN